MVKAFLTNIFLAFLLVFSYPAFAQRNDVKEEIFKMLAACDSLKTSSFNLLSTEHLKDGTYHKSEILAKLQRNPKNVYIYCIDPNPGAECLWRAGKLNNLLLINPNGFPFFNLKLNAYHPLLRNGQHHTVEQLGFDYIAEIFKHYIEQDGEKIFDLFILNGTAEFDGRQCKVLQYENPAFAYDSYVIKEKENLTRVAHANYISDYMLLAINKLKSYDGVKPGQEIKLPATYGKKIVLYLDERTHLPLVQMIYDEKGLYEKYEFKSFVLNPQFIPDDFSPDNKKYGF